MTLKFKKNETFYIRDGWVEKTINALDETKSNIFFKNNGIKVLGIGSNMVKGLKYWVKAANIVSDDKNCTMTEFSKLLLQYDRYMDQKFSWFFLHYYLSTNKEECPIFYEMFSLNNGITKFKKNELLEYLLDQFSSEEQLNRKYVENDLNIFIKSYVNEDVLSNPEENFVCPLSSLKLIKKVNDHYEKTKPTYSSLSYLIVYYALYKLYAEKNVNSFDIEDSMNVPESPANIFDLDKYMYLKYLDAMRKAGLVTINKTAGLNTVYFEKIMSLDKIFEEGLGNL